MRVLLSVLFVLVFLAGLVIFAPARLVYDALGPVGVQSGLVQGTVWDGQALRVRRGNFEVRQVDTALVPFSLLSGRMRVDAEITDPAIQVRAMVSVGSDQIDIHQAHGVVTLSALSSLSMMSTGLFPLDASLQLEGVSVTLDHEGRCLSAEGAMMSPALADLGARYDVDLPIVDMTVRCDGDALALALTGAGPVLDLEGVVLLEEGRSSYRIRATPHDPEASQVLSLLGFRADGADWVAESGPMGE